MTYVPNMPGRQCRHAPLWTYSHAINNVKHVCLIFLTPCVSQVANSMEEYIMMGPLFEIWHMPRTGWNVLDNSCVEACQWSWKLFSHCTETVKPHSDVKGILNLNEVSGFLSILQSLLNTSAESIENNNELLLLNNDWGWPYCWCSIYIFSHCPLTSWCHNGTFDSLW